MAKKKFSAGLTFIACLLALIIGFSAAFFIYTYVNRESGGDVYVSGDLSIYGIGERPHRRQHLYQSGKY